MYGAHVGDSLTFGQCVVLVCLNVIFFFFQAEDGIRDDLVTGVQTCALPIFEVDGFRERGAGGEDGCGGNADLFHAGSFPARSRSQSRTWTPRASLARGVCRQDRKSVV